MYVRHGKTLYGNIFTKRFAVIDQSVMTGTSISLSEHPN